ncbi:MAG TPA: MBL fold metallo-hydrolase [Candidatus Eisenbacteria bacterium]|nr:MBL fold metallo-hydrolase [Candidatus Eisenbacteria bacterium]
MNPTHAAPELSPEELVQRVESGAPLRVLDIRANTSNGRIDILPADRYVNIRGSQVMAMGASIAGTLPKADPVAVVCERGNSSKQLAAHLNDLGYRAESMRGGMAAWGMAVVARPLPAPAGFDVFLQFDRVAKGATGYLLGAGGQAVIVDPPRKAQPFLEAARAHGLHVTAVADTHAHADYISGGPGLARGLGVPYYLHPHDAILPYDGTPAKLDFTKAEEGTTIPVGPASLRVVHTPGHTLGSVTYFAGDETALTGDFIFVNSIGRPDLGGKAAEWTKLLWNSLERARREWKPETRLYPGHYASDAEREADRTIGRAFSAIQAKNEPLHFKDEASFTAWVMTKVGGSPESYRKIKAVNLGLLEVWDMEAQELDCGRNECALG